MSILPWISKESPNIIENKFKHFLQEDEINTVFQVFPDFIFFKVLWLREKDPLISEIIERKSERRRFIYVQFILKKCKTIGVGKIDTNWYGGNLLREEIGNRRRKMIKEESIEELVEE